MSEPGQTAPTPQLERRFNLLQATALNMSNMVGVGPFVTIPLLMSALNGGGPQAMIGWVVALVLAAMDGMIWSELAAAMPGSGGSYLYLKEGFGPQKWGRLMAFLFIWQFLLSGPLEIASGYIGFIQYLSYLWPGITLWQTRAVLLGIGALNVWLLYRRITSIGKITVSLWVGMVFTCLLVLISGTPKFDARIAFDFPSGAFQYSVGFLAGLGTASRIGVYDYLGYYDVCYIGAEVKEPGRVIPKSIFLSILVVGLLYIGMNLLIIGVVPWREFVPAENNPNANYVVSIFMERLHGKGVASWFTGLVLWTGFASCFALLLGYSRIPHAAAKDGCFFKWFGELHPTRNFPHRSLLLMGVLAAGLSFMSLGEVIDSMMTTRIVVQFLGQIGALILLRKHRPDLARPYKVWLYPLPCVIAGVGWLFIFCTSGEKAIRFGLGTLVVGILAYLAWARWMRHWPFVGAKSSAMK